MIDSFTDDYAFLSNFYEHPFEYGGVLWPTAEHAFQASKVDPDHPDWECYIDLFLEAKSPGLAKKLGRTVPLDPDWEEIKDSVMKDILMAKFEDVELQRLLYETGDQQL